MVHLAHVNGRSRAPPLAQNPTLHHPSSKHNRKSSLHSRSRHLPLSFRSNKYPIHSTSRTSQKEPDTPLGKSILRDLFPSPSLNNRWHGSIRDTRFWPLVGTHIPDPLLDLLRSHIRRRMRTLLSPVFEPQVETPGHDARVGPSHFPVHALRYSGCYWRWGSTA